MHFCSEAGIKEEFAIIYAKAFAEHEIDKTMLPDLDHSMLISLKVLLSVPSFTSVSSLEFLHFLKNCVFLL